jgi:hypothetical protein
MKPFNMIIVGMTASGKNLATTLLTMLEEEYKGVFENIFLMLYGIKPIRIGDT